MEVIVSGNGEKIFANKDCCAMFDGFQNLTKIVFKSFDTSKVTNMFQMFRECTSFVSLDLSVFDTSSVTNMVSMFENCKALAILNLNSFDTSKVTEMYNMFENCIALENIDLNSFNTSNVTEMYAMFQNCTSLKTIIVSEKFETTKVTDSDNMFYNCDNLVGGEGTKYNSAYTDATYACIDGGTKAPGYFTGTQVILTYSSEHGNVPEQKKVQINHKLTAADLPELTEIGWNLIGWNKKIGDVITEDTTITAEWKKRQATLATQDTWFNEELSGITKDKITKITFQMEPYTGNGTISKSWLCNDSDSEEEIKAFLVNNTEIVVSGNGAEIMANPSSRKMFSGFTNVKSIIFSSFNTSKVTDMFHMFENCTSLGNLDLSGFDTSNVTYMSAMFLNCSSLKSLDLSNFNTSKVNTDTLDLAGMSSMFSGCSNLVSLDLSNFDTSNVRTMNSMFSGCSSLKTLDLTSFDTKWAKNNMNQMFYNCTSLVTIKVGKKYVINNVDLSKETETFTNCKNLVGGAGTKYNSEKTNLAYARIDGGPSNPGYFTAATQD